MADIKGVLVKALDKSLDLQRPVIVAHIKRLRRTRPDARPAEILRALERHYLATVTSTGGAAGATAALPGVGTAIGAVVNVGEIPVFLEATALFALAYAEVYGVRIDDLERRRTLVLAVLLGQSGTKTIEKIAGRTGTHWARMLVKGVDPATLTAINKVLGRNFVTKYGAKEGILVLGRELPFFLGAGIGAVGNAGSGYLSVRAARRVFGPPQADWSLAAD